MSDEVRDVSEDVDNKSFGGAFVEESVREVLSLPEFDPRWHEPLNGLLFLGNLTMNFTWPGPTGHKFKVKTIDTDTYLKAALFTKKYEASLGDMRAYQLAIVAACLISIDGLPLPLPAFAGEDEYDARIQWCKAQYSWTIDAIYNQFCVLENIVAQVIEELGKASGAPSVIGGSNPDSDSQEIAAYLAVVDPSITYRN